VRRVAPSAHPASAKTQRACGDLVEARGPAAFPGEHGAMRHSKPSPLGTLFLVVLIAALIVPGVVVVVLDSVPRRLPWTYQSGE
jgi:hypothetical protein